MPIDPIELYGGKVDGFADSMAEDMEKALNQVREEQDMVELPIGDKDRRMLFIAIARGVINHLEKKQEAFTIIADNGNAGHEHGGFTEIKVKRPPDVPL